MCLFLSLLLTEILFGGLEFAFISIARFASDRHGQNQTNFFIVVTICEILLSKKESDSSFNQQTKQTRQSMQKH